MSCSWATLKKTATWSNASIRGCRRFLERSLNLLEMIDGEKGYGALEKNFHRTIEKVGGDIEELKFNTAIAALMTLLNDIYAAGSVTREALSVYIRLLSPFAPHLAEEMWQQIGQPRPIAEMGVWPSFDPAKTVDDTIEIPVQVNGKLKSRIEIPVGAGAGRRAGTGARTSASPPRLPERRSLSRFTSRISL